MSVVMRVQNFSSLKNSVTMVESYGKWLTEALHECKAELRDLLSICSICNRSLHRVLASTEETNLFICLGKRQTAFNACNRQRIDILN